MRFERKSWVCRKSIYCKVKYNWEELIMAKLLKFGVSNSEAWEVGLTCGGKVEVFVEKIGDNDWKTKH